MDNDKVIDLLNDLIETCKDGQEGFRQAAEYVRIVELKSFFNDVSLVRGRMVSDLQARVLQFGGRPDTHGSVSGALHRTWLGLKGTVSLNDGTVLSSVEAGEDAAVKSFEKVLKEPLPPDLLNLIEQQYRNIKNSHDQVRKLRDSGLYKTKTV